MRRGPWALEADKALRSLSIPQEALHTSTSGRCLFALTDRPKRVVTSTAYALI